MKRISYHWGGKALGFILVCLAFGCFVTMMIGYLTYSNNAISMRDVLAKDYINSNEVRDNVSGAYYYLDTLLEYKSEENIMAKDEPADNYSGVLDRNTGIAATPIQRVEIYGYPPEDRATVALTEIYDPYEDRPTVDLTEIYDPIADPEQERADRVRAFLNAIINLNAIEGLYYYASDGEYVFTNCSMTTAEEFKQYQHHNIVDSDSIAMNIGDNNLSYANYRHRAGTAIYLAYDDDFIAQKQLVFSQVKEELYRNAMVTVALFSLGLLLLIYLVIVSGRELDGKSIPLAIDRLWSEVTAGLLVATVGMYLVVFSLFSYGSLSYAANDMPILVVTVSALFCAVGLFFFLSLVRNIKNGVLISNSLCYKAYSGMVVVGKTIFDFTPLSVKIIGAIIVAEFLAIVSVFVAIGSSSILSCLLLLTLFTAGVLYFLLKYVLKPYDDEVTTRLQASVNKEMKAERLKTELITNVSHDLKTPLTAILNYADLLLKQDDTNEYAKIIHEKSRKLQDLTEGLFEVSKAQSGNIAINKETLNLSELINQTLAELDEHSVEFKINIPDVTITADGKLMSRVFENLMGNITKYSLPNTRAYIDAFQEGGKTHITFKNIANYEMNFDSSEITARFARGDASRTTNGSGLGLAIAQSYVEACGGNLTINVDGDLFKVTVVF